MTKLIDVKELRPDSIASAYAQANGEGVLVAGFCTDNRADALGV